jgi:class 3 adenylate cyclase
VRTGDERKLVTILFADLVGSTAYADERDPERVRVALERFYAAMQTEIERTGGTVEKFAGAESAFADADLAQNSVEEVRATLVALEREGDETLEQLFVGDA